MSKILERSFLQANEKEYKQVMAKLNPSNSLSTEQKSAMLKQYMSTEDGRQAFAALQTEKVSLLVQAQTIGADFFIVKNLQPDEAPIYEVEDVRPMIPVTVVSSLGGSATTIYSDGLNRVPIPLSFIESDWVKAQRIDLVQGFIDRSDKISNDLSYSLTNKKDDLAWAALSACFGTLGSDTWVLDPKIKNVPTTNDVDLSAICKGLFTKDLIKGVVTHFAQIGKPIRALYMPASRKQDVLDWIAVSDKTFDTTNTVPADVVSDIWKTGGLPTGGLIPPIVFTNVLDGETTGSIYCYAMTNDAPGYLYQKPALHMTDTKTEGPWYMAKTLITGTFVIPPYRKQNVARFKIG